MTVITLIQKIVSFFDSLGYMEPLVDLYNYEEFDRYEIYNIISEPEN